jgi:F-type H+-transporting ATPase subunit alpha
LAQYRELAAFAQFASDLDDATRKQLERGRRVTELLKQAQYQPLQVWQLAASLYAANNGFLDDVEVKDVLAFEKNLHDTLKTKYADLITRIETTQDLNKEDEATLRAAIETFKKSIG